MSENSKDFISWIDQVEKTNADLAKLPKAEREKLIAEENIILDKMESSEPSFED